MLYLTIVSSILLPGTSNLFISQVLNNMHHLNTRNLFGHIITIMNNRSLKKRIVYIFDMRQAEFFSYNLRLYWDTSGDPLCQKNHNLLAEVTWGNQFWKDSSIALSAPSWAFASAP